MNRYAKTPYKNSEGRTETDGKEGAHNVHAEGSDMCDMETLCGYVWSGIKWIDTTKPVTCVGCLDVIALVRKNHPKGK